VPQRPCSARTSKTMSSSIWLHQLRSCWLLVPTSSWNFMAHTMWVKSCMEPHSSDSITYTPVNNPPLIRFQSSPNLTLTKWCSLLEGVRTSLNLPPKWDLLLSNQEISRSMEVQNCHQDRQVPSISKTLSTPGVLDLLKTTLWPPNSKWFGETGTI